MRLHLATAALALLAGCGYVGPPLPPALDVPRPITDLSVVELGDKIIVRFTPPTETTEDLPITELQAITLYIGPGEAEFSRDRWAATATQYPIAVAGTDVRELEIPASDWVGQQLVLAVRTTGRTGRESDWSLYEYLSVGTPLDIPSAVTPTNARDAVALNWTGNAPRYRVLRSVLSDPATKLEPIGETDAAEYVDSAIVYGMRYRYVILGIAGERQQSLPSPPIDFAPADVIAPAAPAGLRAVPGTRSVDLSWTRSPDADLEGYNVFRAVGDGPFTALEQRVPLPAYTDTSVESGMRYRYMVSAIDKAGNESDRSPEAAAQVE